MKLSEMMHNQLNNQVNLFCKRLRKCLRGKTFRIFFQKLIAVE